jgi:hypothetical protein
MHPDASAATGNVGPAGRGSGIERVRTGGSGKRSTDESALDLAIPSRPRRSRSDRGDLGYEMLLFAGQSARMDSHGRAYPGL